MDLRERILAVRAIAEAATPGPWQREQGGEVGDLPSLSEGFYVSAVAAVEADDPPMGGAFDRREDVTHIALHDPQRVIAACDADLELLDRCEKYVTHANASPGAASWAAMAETLVIPSMEARYPA